MQIDKLIDGWTGVFLSIRQWQIFLTEDLDWISWIYFWESLNEPLFRV